MSTETRVRVLVDQTPSNPRDDDNVGTMACWHRRYTLGDVQPDDTPDEYTATLEADHQGRLLILPLYLYDHSGITMRTSDFGDRWDSGRVGIIWVSFDRIAQEWGEGPEAIDKARAYLEGEVKTYATYLEGRVYGFIIEEGTRCDQGHMHWEQTESCWGFLGEDIEANGMTEHVPERLHAALKSAMASPEVGR